MKKIQLSTGQIIIIVLLVLILGAMAYLIYQNQTMSCRHTELVADIDGQVVDIETNAERFAAEYGISEDNVFVYRSAPEIIDILENGSGVVYLGFPECQWCSAYVPILNEVAMEKGIEKIYYYNIGEARSNNTAEYQRMVELLGENLDFDEEGQPRIFVPDVSFVLNGEILAHNNETATVSGGSPEEYWTSERREELKKILGDYMTSVLPQYCTTGCDY